MSVLAMPESVYDSENGISINESLPKCQNSSELSERYEKMNFFRRYILEITFMAFTFPTMLLMVPLTDIMMRKSCEFHLQYPSAVCNDISNDTFNRELLEVERVTKVYGLLKDIVVSIPGIAASIIAGQYMARYGAKAVLIVAHLGSWLSLIGDSITFWNMEMPLYFNVLSQIPTALTGGMVIFMAAVFSNITITCPSEKRKFRFLVFQFFIFIPMLLAMVSGGTLYWEIGIKNVSIISCSLFSIPLILVVFFYQDYDISTERKNESFLEGWRHSTNLDTFKKSISYLTRPRPGQARGQVYCMFLCLMVGVTAFTGAGDLNQIYVQHLYKWNASFYSLMNSVTMIMTFGLSVPLMYLFVNVLDLSDPVVIAVGFLSLSAKFFAMSIMFLDSFIYYLQCLIGLPFIIGLTGIRSHLSRLLEEHEVTVIFALTSASEKVLPVFSDIMVTTIYNSTNDFFPGLVFAVEGAIYIIPFIASLFCLRWTRRDGYPTYKKMDESGDMKLNSPK